MSLNVATIVRKMVVSKGYRIRAREGARVIPRLFAMIRIVANNYGVHILGHAGFAPAGQDIICAGVSTLAFTLIEGMRNYCGMELTVTGDPKNGEMNIAWDELTDEGRILLNTFVDGIGLIKHNYGHILTENRTR